MRLRHLVFEREAIRYRSACSQATVIANNGYVVAGMHADKVRLAWRLWGCHVQRCQNGLFCGPLFG